MFVITMVLFQYFLCKVIRSKHWKLKKSIAWQKNRISPKVDTFFLSIDGNDWLVTRINVRMYLSIVLFFIDKDWYSSRGRNDCKRNLQNTICFSITLIYVWSVFIWYLLSLSNKWALLNFFNQRDITHKNHIFALIFKF